jgi:hypothetical protein
MFKNIIRDCQTVIVKKYAVELDNRYVLRKCFAWMDLLDRFDPIGQKK